jgi:hypothetical protein
LLHCANIVPLHMADCTQVHDDRAMHLCELVSITLLATFPETAHGFCEPRLFDRCRPWPPQSGGELLPQEQVSGRQWPAAAACVDAESQLALPFAALSCLA